MTFLDRRIVDNLRALAAEPGPGDVLNGRFELRDLIGDGAMGVVFAAWDRQTNLEVAVKILRDDDPRAEQRFQREAAALAQVSHPSIVRYIAVGSHDRVSFLVMERLIGTTLSDLLARGPLSVSDTVSLGRQLAEALSVLRKADLTHRDLKPSNVFLVNGDPAAVRLLDFGLVRGQGLPRVTQTGAVVGTVGYMAPEQVRGDRAIGPKSDVFALGAVLFECLAARPAFCGESAEALLAQILLEDPVPLREIRPEVPPGLERLVNQMLSKRDAGRPNSEQVARELVALTGEVPTQLYDMPVQDRRELDLQPGDVVAGKYQIEHAIGEGGMGRVLAARHLELGKRVALKVLQDGRGRNDDARFLREARAAARLESQHVVRVLDLGRLDDGSPFMVMEYLKGEDLACYLKRMHRLGVGEAVDIVMEACEAIAEAHALGIVHRDIKPSNLFLATQRDGTSKVKVLDFGISKITKPLEGASQESLSMTGATAVMGSVWYMSPEQLQGSKHVGTTTDIWALGAVLHELLTGMPPFEGDSAAAVGARIAAAEPTPLRMVAKDAPERLEAVVLTCLNKDPNDRFADIGAFARALAPFGSSGLRSSTDRIEAMVRSAAPPSPMQVATQSTKQGAISALEGSPERWVGRSGLSIGKRSGLMMAAAFLLGLGLFFVFRLLGRQTASPAIVSMAVAASSSVDPAERVVVPTEGAIAPSVVAPDSNDRASAPLLVSARPPNPAAAQPALRPSASPAVTSSGPAPNPRTGEVDLRDPALQRR